MNSLQCYLSAACCHCPLVVRCGHFVYYLKSNELLIFLINFKTCHISCLYFEQKARTLNIYHFSSHSLFYPLWFVLFIILTSY